MAKWGVPKATSEDRKAGIPLAGEVLYDKDEKALYYGDGATQGGVPLHNRSQESAYVYGLDFDLATTATAGTKVVLNHAYDFAGASTALRYHAVDSFAQTPAHAFQGVLRDLENGVNKCFLDVSDSTHKADGTALTENEKKGIWTESGGGTTLVDFMLRIPITYWRKDTYTDGSGHNPVVWLVSNEQFVDSAPHPWFFTGSGGATAQVQYVGMFKGVLTDSTGTPKTQSAESTPVSFASGDRLRSIMGYRPAGSMTRATFRTAAGNNHGNLTNMLFREWLTLMVAIDGGNLNSQAAISFGFANCSAWDYASLRKTGRAATFGLQNGEVTADETEETGLDLDLLTMKDGGSIWNNSGSRVVAFNWRGLENPWAAQWEFADGCQKYQNATADDYSQSGYWTTNDISIYSNCDSDMGAWQQGEKFPSRGYTGNSYAWVNHAWPKAAGYIKTFDTDSFFAITIGGGADTYFGDYVYNDANAGARVVYFGGHAGTGAADGVGYAGVNYALSLSHAGIGARLAASGENE
ncbi:MAG: hypothetical protein IJT68_07105 [Lentisphaeria bacterium]|nr:hypothetical protein [Lentisphaeria bacterium]